MLNGTRNASSNVQVGANGNAGLAYVLVVRTPANIGHRTRTSSCSAKLTSQLLNHAPVFGTFEATASRNYQLGFGERHTIATFRVEGTSLSVDTPEQLEEARRMART